MLSHEQLEQIKKQLFKQVENLPDEQKEQLEQQLNEMDDEQFEAFLVKNKLMSVNQDKNESPFRSIVEGKIPSLKIAENDYAIAILEINPLSKGHTIIISKNPKDDLKHYKKLSEEVSEKLKSKLNCIKVEINEAEILGEKIMNLIPIYDNSKLERKKASNEELKELQELILKEDDKKDKEQKTIKKVRKIPISKLPKAPRRIP